MRYNPVMIINQTRNWGERGIDGRFFYRDVRDWLKGQCGELWETGAACMALCSINVGFEASKVLSMRMFELVKNDVLVEKEEFGTIIARKCEEWQVTGEVIGPKIRPYWQAILGEEEVVPVDRWMLRAYRWKSSTPRRRLLIQSACILVANEQGMTPAQMQACVWEGVRNYKGE